VPTLVVHTLTKSPRLQLTMAHLQQQPGFASQPQGMGGNGSQTLGSSLESPDAVSSYFECITACSLDDGECVTRCVEVLRDNP
jgi:hypothetical protein